MVHAALLLLMLEAANARPRFTISLKRSTSGRARLTAADAINSLETPLALAQQAHQKNDDAAIKAQQSRVAAVTPGKIFEHVQQILLGHVVGQFRRLAVQGLDGESRHFGLQIN
jgi:hypothetical protein